MTGNDHANGNGNGAISLFLRHHGMTPPARADREPPNNPEAERSLLGSILHDNKQLEKVRPLLRVQDFYQDRYAIVYQCILDLADHGDAPEIDFLSLQLELERQGKWEAIGKHETITELYESANHGANAEYFAGIVRERAIARRVIDSAAQSIDEAYSNQHTAQDLVELASKRLIAAEPPEAEDELMLPGAWPEELHPDAFYGVAGELVRRIEPHTEADPAALLLQFLCAFGNAIGHGPHWMVGPARHGLNLYVAIVGRSSRARKGTSWTFVETVMRQVDEEWAKNRVSDGLSTGEGMIEAVRDPKYKREKVAGAKELGGGGYEEILVDPGEDDKRMLWIEGEFGSVLSIKGRDGNVLDGTIRKLWETGSTGTRSKNNPSRCTEAHVSIIGHVTVGELLRKMSDIDVSGGFANRFLWICSRRRKLIARPTVFRLGDILDLVVEIKDALDGVRFVDWKGAPLSMSEEAWAIYESLYAELGRDRPGILDDLCSRAEPQVLRLASLYAVLDKSTQVQVPHLKAALAIWDYSEASVRCIFGERAFDDPDEAKLLAALKAAPDGLSTYDLSRRVFRGHKPSAELGAILGRLLRAGKIAQVATKTTGRDRTIWKLSIVRMPGCNGPDPAR